MLRLRQAVNVPQVTLWFTAVVCVKAEQQRGHGLLRGGIGEVKLGFVAQLCWFSQQDCEVHWRLQVASKTKRGLHDASDGHIVYLQPGRQQQALMNHSISFSVCVRVHVRALLRISHSL